MKWWHWSEDIYSQYRNVPHLEKSHTDWIKYARNKNVNVQQAHLKLSEECHISTDTVFLTAFTRVSHIVLLCCVFMEAEDSVPVTTGNTQLIQASLSLCSWGCLLFVFFSFKCFCHQLLFFFSLRNFVLTEHLVEAGGGGEECETDEERLWWPYMDNLKIVPLDAGNSSWSLFFLWWLQMKRIEESVHAVFFLCFLLQMFKTFHLTTPQSLLLPSVWSSGSVLPASLLWLWEVLLWKHKHEDFPAQSYFCSHRKSQNKLEAATVEKKQLLASRPK